MRLTGAIPKQSNSTVQIRPPPLLNLRRKPELDLLPLELDFLYGLSIRQSELRTVRRGMKINKFITYAARCFKNYSSFLINNAQYHVFGKRLRADSTNLGLRTVLSPDYRTGLSVATEDWISKADASVN